MRHKIWAKGYVATLAAVMVLTANGCNTVKGLAKDLHDSAQAVQDAIEQDLGVPAQRREW